MDDLKLIYIQSIGENWKGNYLYEFLFSDTLEVDGEDWDAYPALGKPTPPNESYIKCVGELITSVKLDVIQESDSFCLYDAMDNIISLAWENIDEHEVYPEDRMSFSYGQNLSEVKKTLYSKDLTLKIKEV